MSWLTEPTPLCQPQTTWDKGAKDGLDIVATSCQLVGW